MKLVKMLEAKTHLSRIVKQIRSGAEREIVIAVGDQPAARIVPLGASAKRPLGMDEGLVSLAPDFDSADATIARLFTARRR